MKPSLDWQILIFKITRFRSTGRTKRTAALVKDWQKLSQPEKDAWEKKAAARYVILFNCNFHTKKGYLFLCTLLRCPDPVSSKLRPDSNFGSVSETLDEIIENYVSEKKSGKGFNEIAFRDLVRKTFMLISYK